MSEIITVGLDLAKNVFQVHGADGAGRAVVRKKLRRGQVLDFFSQLPSCLVAMEACGGAHFWGREIGKLGYEVRLIPLAEEPALLRQGLAIVEMMSDYAVLRAQVRACGSSGLTKRPRKHKWRMAMQPRTPASKMICMQRVD
ncbi:hypothetical protein SAMN05444959_10222 [Paracoccus seriniphilus]|uniref:Transposase n=1 Tax=Paracoccus seriniphilus TaxID=184748 RepID=A0A239PMH0_9RHOB|nr:hypothetical protein SAMN05444959_10222 [Paracoccus seriniphilus]